MKLNVDRLVLLPLFFLGVIVLPACNKQPTGTATTDQADITAGGSDRDANENNLGVRQDKTEDAIKSDNRSGETATDMQTDDQHDTRYLAYSSDAFQAARNKTRVLFFHASWCPSCRAAEADITSKLDRIPENVVIFKTDYDTETELKNKYDITYQHTFVVVNEAGNEIDKWNGGSLDDIIERVS